jgi:hypothetical protein
MRNVSNRSFIENKTSIFSLISYFRKMYRLGDNVEEFCGTGLATYDNNTSTTFACWITKATKTHSE